MQRARNDLPTSHMESLAFYLESVGVRANQGGGDLVRTLFKILGRGTLKPGSKGSYMEYVVFTSWQNRCSRNGFGPQTQTRFHFEF